jgi:hypothetical protein
MQRVLLRIEPAAYNEMAESQGNMCGMRVTLSVTLNATGQIADFFVVVVSLLSYTELPEETCREGMVHMEIEGLATGGATSSSNKQWSLSEVMEQINSTYVAIFCTGWKSSHRLSTKFGNLLAELPLH